MNLVKTYIKDKIALEEPILKDMPLFMNGMTITQADSDMELLVYQEPFSDIVALVIYDENHVEIGMERYAYLEDKEEWEYLQPRKGKTEH